jgi:Fatty acid cis/trans isomerase (CTI)
MRAGVTGTVIFHFCSFRCPLIAGLILLISGCMQPQAVDEIGPGPTVSATQTYSYTRDIKPVLDQKCIACHACYDAPCQLKLSSAEGLLRGATRKQVYDSGRLKDVAPTRLFVDARNTAGWRDKGFYSLLNEQGGPLDNNLEQSLLYNMIELGREHPLAANAAVPDDIKLGLQRKNECPLPAEFERYAEKKPLQGMPLAITGLDESEFQTLRQWIREGAVIDATPVLPGPEEQQQIDQWEAFFNRPALKNQLVSRYLYEHLFLAHLYFEQLNSGNFFELVRSSTPSGESVRIIPTVRPNDDPGLPFYYRLRKIESTIVHKTHITYPLSDEKMVHLDALFLTPDWELAQLPDYSVGDALNPFATYSAIPARARYQFMLDSAQYTVMTFIRGPVCRGQVATDVIDDQFYVLFQDPDADLSVTDPAYLASVQPYLMLTGENERLLALAPDWEKRKRARDEYIRLRGKAYRDLQPAGPSLQDIWDGGGTNDNAALTVFRNFDNATVTRGFVGAIPKTLWVMDYPMLERTYYELVVNFNVFGSAASQADTRLYFDLIRSGGENNFLHFMPPGVRTALRDSWYQGRRAERKLSDDYVIVNEDMPVQIHYRTRDPKAEFVALVSARLKSLAGPPDVLNRCARPPCYRAGATAAERQVDASLQTLTSKPASIDGMQFVDFMPDVSFVRVSSGDPEADLAYTLVRNKAHTNVAFLLGEEKRREPGKDTLTAFHGLLGSYPNFMFNVPLDSVESFAADLHAVRTREQFIELVGHYGLSRTHPDIWANFQWFGDYMRRVNPVDAGVYDLNRYKKVADLMADESG